MVKVEEKYFKTKYRPAGILVNVNTVIYFKFKSQIKFRSNNNSSSIKVYLHTVLKKYVNLQLKNYITYGGGVSTVNEHLVCLIFFVTICWLPDYFIGPFV
jgi:hypothetical protein